MLPKVPTAGPREGAAVRPDRRRVEPLVLRSASGGDVADDVGPVRSHVAVLAGVAVAHVEVLAARDVGARVELPAADHVVEPLRHVAPDRLAAAERAARPSPRASTVCVRAHSGAPYSSERSKKYWSVPWFMQPLQGVGREQRVAVAEPLGELRLHRVVVVVGAVAEVAHRLRPAVRGAVSTDRPRVERPPEVARHVGKARERRLVEVDVGPVTVEDVRALVADVRRPPRRCRWSAAAGSSGCRRRRRADAGSAAGRTLGRRSARGSGRSRRRSGKTGADGPSARLKTLAKFAGALSCWRARIGQVLGHAVAERRAEDADVVAAAVAHPDHGLLVRAGR